MNNLERYFHSKYNKEFRKEYCIATLLDPRYKSAGFRSKDNAGIAKELLIQEVITDRQSNNSSPQTLNVSDRSIAPETPSADPWDAILVDTEDSEENATEDTILTIRGRSHMTSSFFRHFLPPSPPPSSFVIMAKPPLNFRCKLP